MHGDKESSLCTCVCVCACVCACACVCVVVRVSLSVRSFTINGNERFKQQKNELLGNKEALTARIFLKQDK